MLVVATAATKGYLYVWDSFVASLATAAAHHEAGVFVFATDSSKEATAAEKQAQMVLPPNWRIAKLVVMPSADDSKSYNVDAQMRIAALQGAAFQFARSKEKPDFLWSVESDVLVPPNALRVLEWTLQMPQEDGTPYYDVAAATYPNGMFLGGFGTYQNPIAEDFLPRERKLSPRLKLISERCEERIKAFEVKASKEAALNGRNELLVKEYKRRERLMDRIKKSPPQGNVWEMNAKHGWRRRGWLDNAYPAIGKGAIVPSDWCGLGCTLMSKRALALADFNGYDGRGTQDLFLCWHRWHPAGLRIACVPHVVCDHVKTEEFDGKKRKVHYHAYHERDGEMRGHLRVNRIIHGDGAENTIA